MAEQEKDRTEPATPFKLEEAKRRGQVAKSLDFISLVMLSAFLAALYAWADDLARFGLRLSVGALESGAELAFTPPVAAAWLGKISLATLALVAPFLAAAVLAAVVANLVQTGAVFSACPLKPDFQRLNPALGFKRLFSLKVLVETGKTILKLVLFAGVAYLALRDRKSTRLNSSHGSISYGGCGLKKKNGPTYVYTRSSETSRSRVGRQHCSHA